jgi:hypothetical protein
MDQLAAFDFLEDHSVVLASELSEADALDEWAR